MICVLLAEDQAMVRGALASLLSLEDDLEVVGEFERGDAVLAAVRSRRPDLVLLDIELPGTDGIGAAAELAREPEPSRALILTTFGRPGYLRRALEAGAGRVPVSRTRRRATWRARSAASSPASASPTRRSPPRR